MAQWLGKGWLSEDDALQNGYTKAKRNWHNFKYIVTFKWLCKKKDR